VQVAQPEDALVAAVRERLPDVAKLCQVNDELVFHHDAFAADYQEEDLKLLGMAIKFAGLNGKTAHILGNKRETV
jgi:hypothetical protein